ncbi:MAG: class I SAM-dependent methyltransferase [Oscillospiraceae bacterium]|nr:class I SAM-dependent methyltransferase [Oscillospiraceae bacterium]
MSGSSLYKWASFYDRLQEADYDEIGGYYHKLLKENGKSGGVLLDLACGTGTLSRYFADLGYDVIGADISSEMLAEAEKKQSADKPAIKYICRDMTELELPVAIDCCICVLDALNHLSDIEYIRKTFARLSLFMNKGGVLAFDVNTLYKHEESLSGNNYVFDLPEPDNIFCVWQNSYCEDGRVGMTLDVFAREGDSWNRYTETLSETAYPLEKISLLLKDAGFGEVRVYDWLENAPANELSEKAVFVAIKL